MSFFSDFGKGVSTHGKAIGFIARHNLWLYFIWPVVIMVVVWMAGFTSAFALGQWIADTFIGLTGFDRLQSLLHSDMAWLNTVTGILLGLIHFVAGLLVKMLLFAVFIRFIRYIVLILCSPLMNTLSRRTEEIITGKKYTVSTSQFIHDLFRGIGVVFRCLFLELLIITCCLFVSWVPLLNWLLLPFLWIVGWYFVGYNMMDYTYERRRMRISEGTRFTRKHKGIAIGNGMVFSLLLLVPVIGISLAPVLSPVAATLATLEKIEGKIEPQK